MQPCFAWQITLTTSSATLSPERVSTKIAAGLILFIGFLLFYLVAAAKMPDRFGVDGYLNYAATQYLVEHKRIPVVHADTQGIVFSQLGATRSLRPPLTYVLNATSSHLFSEAVGSRKIAMRFGSALLGALTVTLAFISLMLCRLSIAYGVLGALMLGLMPRFNILAATNNDDIGAVFSVALIGACCNWVLREREQLIPILALAAAVGVVFISKYTAWICLPFVVLALWPALKQRCKDILRWSPVLITLWVIAGGWWPIFNMFHYGVFDPTALGHASQLQAELTSRLPNKQGYWSQGVSLWQLLTNYDQFLSITFASFVGYLPWISMSVTLGVNTFYILAAVLVLAGSFSMARNTTVMTWLAVWTFFLCQFAVYLHHNLLRDIQVDGRYLMPVLSVWVVVAMLGLARLLPKLIGARLKLELLTVYALAIILLGLSGHNLVQVWVPNGFGPFAG